MQARASRFNSILSGLAPFKTVLIVLGWAAALAALALNGIVNAVLIVRATLAIPWTGLILYYGGVFAVSLFAGLILSDLAKSLLGFMASYVIAIVLTWVALVYPSVTGLIDSNTAQSVATAFTFTAFFPFALMIGFIGAILGAAYAEP